MSNIGGIFNPGLKTLQYDTEPLYEYRDMWAEEGGGMNTNSFEWSYGNGATGYIGLPIDEGWELIAMYFQADTGGSATESMEVRLVDIGASPSTAAPVIYTLTISQSGQGVDNNAWVYENLTTPVPIPENTFIGFRSGTEVGGWSDARVGIRLRRKIGDYVSNVYLT
jgi:hypothetical protein